MASTIEIVPVSFGGCAGWLHRACGDVGVILCSPFGLEDICMRRAWCMLAAIFAEAGYPTLRFDPPGCGDSRGDLTSIGGMETLADAATRAAGELRRRASVEALVLVGHGLGAVTASLAAPRVGAKALALLAPPNSGRAWLREFAQWERSIGESLGLDPADAEGGFVLPPRLKASIAAIDLGAATAPPAPSIFLAAHQRSLAGVELTQLWRAQGVDLTITGYEQHAAALEAPAHARPPLALFEAVAGWLKRVAPIQRRRSPVRPAPPARLDGASFSETLTRFGPNGRLAGVLCKPPGRRSGRTVLFLNAGGDPHTGWARGTVEHARSLAAFGVASFRIDLGGLGDSSGRPDGAPPAILDPHHVEDAMAAIDWLETRGLGPVMPSGRGSGAAVAYSAAVRDPRVRDLVLINPSDFAADLADLPERATRRLAYYLNRSRDPTALLRRWAAGDVDVKAAASRLGLAAAGLSLVPFGLDQRARSIRVSWRTLQARGVRIAFLYGAMDPGWAEFQAVFGPDGDRLRRRPGMEIVRLEGGDGALASPAARASVLGLLARRALAPQPAAPDAVPAQDRRHKPPPPRSRLADGAVAP